MTADSGADADNQSKQNPFDAKTDAETPGRKVAKTMVEGQIPQFPDAPEPPQTIDEQDITRKPKRVTKTMLELNRPTAEQIVAASENAAAEEEQKTGRKVPKTMMEVPRPDLSRTETAPKEVSKTMIEVARPDLSGTETAPKKVSQTMMEVARPDLSSTETAPKKVSKTMMEISLPAASETAMHLKKVSKTVLDVNSLDAIGMAKAIKKERALVPVKVRKTLTQDRSLPNLTDVNVALNAAAATESKTVVSAANQELSTTVKSDDSLKKAKNKTRGTERFVAKTMMDHSVLSEQVVKLHEKEKMKAAYIAQEKANEPVKDFQEVDSKKMASPCAWSWNEIGGKKSRVRACERCQTQVYDLSGMEMSEAEALIFKQESKKKFTLYKRADGKFMTTDCPVQAQRKRNLVMLCVAGAVAMIAVVLLMVLMPPPPPPAPATVPKRTNEASLGSPSRHNASTNSQQPPVSGLFPSVTAPAQTTTQTSPVARSSDATPNTAVDSGSTTGKGDPDSKYWDESK